MNAVNTKRVTAVLAERLRAFRAVWFDVCLKMETKI
jgi:hypothetical protein